MIRRARSPSAWFRLPIFAFIASIILFEFPGARDSIETPFSGIETLNLIVQNIDASSPNVGGAVRPGDEIDAVDGVRVRNYNHLRYLVRRNQAFAPQEYRLRRDGQPVSATIHYVPVPHSFIYRRLGQLLVAFTFLLVAILVLWRRGDAIGILFSINCVILAFFLTDRPIHASPALQLSGELFQDAVILLFPAVFLQFFLAFSDRPLHLSRRRRQRRWAFIYGPPALVFAASSVLTVRHFLGVATNQGLVRTLLLASTVYMAAYLVLSLVIFVRNYTLAAPAQKEKLRIAIAGTILGLLPFLLMTVWRQFFPGPRTRVESLSGVGLAFISVSFAYAILKHGAIELNIVVRKSLAYAFLTGAIIAGYYALVNVVGGFVIRELSLEPIYLSAAAVLVLAVLFNPARDRVQRFVDRVFFRGDYDYREEVVEFNRQLSKKLKRDEILEYFFDRIRELLKSSNIALYTPSGENGAWALERATGHTTSLPPLFPKESLLGRHLSRYRKPLMVEYLDHAWGRRHLDGTSRGFLAASGAAVCLPLNTPESFFGLVVLGRKLSGRLYNRTDASLLEGFSDHLGLVLENARLHEAAIEQERLKNEVLLAREIQLGLLPKSPPVHPTLEILGRMESSVEVGGDYFDYFAVKPGRIGLAVGDGTGKGVPAAMLMASLQAVFKNLVLRDPLSPSELLAELNRYVCDHAKGDQFATFFYGILDPERGTLTFSNAGHCPGLLVRKDFADRLGEGGVPLGVDRAQTYEEGRVRFGPGDLLCLYTDGVVEQRNRTGDEFGEARLIEFLQANRNLPVAGLPKALFASVRAFGENAQDDDVTAVIARHLGT